MDQLPPDAIAPSSSRPDDIRSSLHDTWKEIELVKERIKSTIESIEGVNTLLEDLRALETELLNTAKSKAWSLSPVKKLSTDTISEIVGHITSHSISLSTVDCMIWPMTHVCSSWRRTIISLPHLWSTFSVNDLPPLEMVSTVLERSGSHPLSFSVSTSYSPEITSLLVNCSERWKDVEIEISAGSAILLRLHRRLPVLESLKLQCSGIRRADLWTDSEEERRIFEDAPKLSKLELEYLSSTLPVAFRFPIKQLAQYESDWDSSSGRVGPWRLDDLSGFSKLSSLTLFGSMRPLAPAFVHDRTPPIELAAVTHLQLYSTLSPLGVMVVPSLRELKLSEVWINNDGLVVLRRLLSSILSGRLKRFCLGLLSSGNDSRCIEELLAHPGLEHVQKLVVNRDVHGPDRRGAPPNSNWLESFLSRLTYVPDQPLDSSRTESRLLLPNLRDFSLTYEYNPEDGMVLDALKDLVTSRTSVIDGLKARGDLPVNAPARLEAIYIKHSWLFEHVTMENFHQLRAGLVKLCSHSETDNNWGVYVVVEA